MLAKEAEPDAPERVGALQHHLHQPAGMDAGVIGQRQLHDVVEVVGQHRLTLAVRQPVGLQGDEGAADDGEQPETDPGREQRPDRGRYGCAGSRGLAVGECVDDPAEQDRLCELRDREQDVGEGKQPAEPGFRSERFENTAVEADKRHISRIDGAAGGASVQGQSTLRDWAGGRKASSKRSRCAGRLRNLKSAAICSTDASKRSARDAADAVAPDLGRDDVVAQHGAHAFELQFARAAVHLRQHVVDRARRILERKPDAVDGGADEAGHGLPDWRPRTPG